jgi:bacillopeptidase F (M6 metalloprotease family)
MEPARYDITIHQGATFNLGLQYKTSSGVPVNMSGYTVEAQLWNRNGTAKLANFSIPWITQASGIFKLSLSSSVTSGITEQGQYDVLITEPSGGKSYLLQGTAFVNAGLSGRGV